MKNSLGASTVEVIESEIEKVIWNIRGRNKLIKLADITKGGCSTLEEYETCAYADDSDDDKISDMQTALQKKRSLQPHRPAMVPSSKINRPPTKKQGRRTTQHIFPVWAQGSTPKGLSGTNQLPSAAGISSPAAVVLVSTIDWLGISSVAYNSEMGCKKGCKLKLLPMEFDCGHWVWATMSSRYVNKMIKSRARFRFVCSLPAYCVKFLTSTLRTVWVTRQERKAYLCVLYATCNAVLHFGDLWCQIFISNCLDDIIS